MFPLNSVALLFALVGLAGCAGGSLAKIETASELPPELAEKFEVKDSSALPPSPAVAATSTQGETKAALVPAAPAAAPDASALAKKTAMESAVAPIGKPADKKASKRKKKGAASAAAVSEPAPDAPFAYPSRRPAKDPIWVGEKHVFDITYFGMSAGDFTLDILPFKAMGERKVYHIKGTAISSSLFNLFYRINDTVESFLDYEGLFSHRFHLALDETKQVRDSLELYDSEKKQTFYWNRWNRKEKGYVETKEYHPIPPFSNDTLSALYYLRTVPLPDDAVISVPIVSEGKAWEAVVTVVRREMMDTPIGRTRCVVLKPEMKFQGILKKQGDSFIWLTDDDRRFVVRLEAKVKIGTVVAALKRVEAGEPPAP